MDDRNLIRLYSRDQIRRGLAASTVESRAGNLHLFVVWLNGKPLLEVGRRDIEAFLDARNLGARARYRWISDLHCLYRFALDEDYTTVDPTTRISRPRLPKLLPRPISSDDLAAAVELAPRVMRCVLLLAAYEGMRCVEISRLCREDILDTMEPGVLLARGKGAKLRALPIHPDVWHALRALPLPRSGFVFRRPDGRPMSAADVSHAGNDYLHDLGLDATVHQLRHWFGTELYARSAHDLLLVRDLLGHSSIATTEGYAAFDRTGAAAAVYKLTTRSAVPLVEPGP